MDNKEPRLYRRGKTWWVKYYVSDGVRDVRVRHSLHTSDEKEARKNLIEVTHKRNEGTIQKPSRSFLSELLAEYKRYLQKKLAKKSLQNDTCYLDQFIEWLPGRITRLEQITSRVILCYLTEMTEKRAWKPKTWNRALGVVRGLFKYALDYCGFVSRNPRHENPAIGVKPLKVPKPVIRYLKRKDIQTQLATLARHREMQAIVATLIFAGLRREELTWLTRDDVDLKSGNILIRSKEIDGQYWVAKTNSDRKVPISEDLMPILKRYRPAKSGVWYFPSPLGGRWHPDNLSHALEKLQREHQQGYRNGKRFKPWTCLHFRHTFATQLAMVGITLDKIAKMLGNSVLICERHYAAFVTEDMKDDVQMGIFTKPTGLKPTALRALPRKPKRDHDDDEELRLPRHA